MVSLKYKKTVSLVFILLLTFAGLLTLILSPVEIAGGLVRGYVDSVEDQPFFSKVANGFKTFDSRVSEFFAFHDFCVNAYGGTQKLIGRTLIDDPDPIYEVLKLNNGYLTFKQTGKLSYDNLGDYLINLKKTCDDTGAQFLYVDKPDKDTVDKNLLPTYYPYAYGDNYDEFETKMAQNSINTLSIEKCFEQHNIDKYSMFFKTDHHWLPSTGLWATKMITQECNEEFGLSLDAEKFDISNYNVEILEESFVGTQGNRVGYWYSDVDDFEVITPKYETELNVVVESADMDLSGSFEDTFIHRKFLESDKLLNNTGTLYQTYMANNFDLVKIENLKNADGKTCVFVMDSFGCTTAPFLSQNFKTTYCIDTRHFKQDINDFVREINPDIVIYMVNWVPN